MQDYQNGRLKGEIEIPMKNKLKNFTNPLLYEKHIENLDNFKKNLIRKCEALQVYLYQSAKNKMNAFIT